MCAVKNIQRTIVFGLGSLFILVINVFYPQLLDPQLFKGGGVRARISEETLSNL